MLARLVISLAAAAGALVSSASAQVAPAGSVDIGTVGFEGSSTGSGADWQVSGSGSDIWGSSDKFHYMYFNRTADVTVTALINSFEGSDNSWRKGGIMFRSHLGERAPHSMIQLTGWGISHQSRDCENCGSKSHHHSYSTSNVWLRLVKKGTTITSYVKKAGDYGFMEYHTEENVDLGTEFKVGIAITSHDDTKLATLDVSSLEISDEVFDMHADVMEIGETGTTVWVQQVKENLWSVSAGGTGIGDTSDSFGYYANNQTGDVDTTVHFEKLTRRNGDTSGGLMIRASNAVDAPHVSLLVKSNDGLTMYWRDAAGGTTHSINKGVWHEDVELRMVKTGTSVACMYKHASAPTWYEIGTASPDLGTTFLVGQAVSSADHGDHAHLTMGVVTVA